MAANKMTSCTNCDEMMKTVQTLTEQVAQLLTIFSKTVPDLKVSSVCNLSAPDVTPSASGLLSRNKSQIVLSVTKRKLFPPSLAIKQQFLKNKCPAILKRKTKIIGLRI